MFVIKEVKITAPWTFVITDLKGEEIVETFSEKKMAKGESNRV